MAVPPAPPPPSEAAEYFRQKALRPAFDHRDVWRQEHRNGFTVAKVTEVEMLAEIQASLQANLDAGGTFQQWVREIRPDLQKRGWWGKRSVVDVDTGEVRETEIGAPSRLRKIYDTNMRQARGAGQWERIERTRAELPYLVYELGPSIEHRPEHVSWEGTLLPASDPWWLSHMPMNGWGCKCGVRQVGRVEYQRLVRDGIRAQGPMEIDGETGLPTGRRIPTTIKAKTEAPPLRLRQWKNKRTGEMEWVPAGIDPGFDYNPGVQRSQAGAIVVRDKVKTLPPEIFGRLEEVVGPTPEPATPAPPPPAREAAPAQTPVLPRPSARAVPANIPPARVATRPVIEVPGPDRGPLEDFVRIATSPEPTEQPPLILGAISDSAASRWPVPVEDRQIALSSVYTRRMLAQPDAAGDGDVPITPSLLYAALLVANSESAEVTEIEAPVDRRFLRWFESIATIQGFRFAVRWERQARFLVPFSMKVEPAD